MSIIGFRLKEPPHPFSVATGLRVSRKEKVVDENAVKALSTRVDAHKPMAAKQAANKKSPVKDPQKIPQSHAWLSIR